MAGLLDFLNTDDARLGLGLLAAGGPSTVPMSVGQRVAGAMQGMDADKQNKMRLALLQSQVDENASQAAIRKQQLGLAERKQAWDEQFMGGGLLGAAPATPSGLGAALGAGVPGASGAAGQAPAAGGFTAAQISQQFGLPMEAVIADYRFNGGKKIAELISDRSKPNWQNVNGNLVNTNAPGFTGGIQGGVAASNDGRVTQYMPDGRGGLVVGAPKGALDTYAAYQGVANRSNADFTPQEVIGEGGRKVVLPRSTVLQPPAGAAGSYRTEADMRTTAQGDMGADPKAIAREIKAIQTDLMTKQLDEPSKAALRTQLADLQRQGQNIGAAPAAGNVVELSPAEQAANDAAKTRAVNTAAADVVRETGEKTQGKSAKEALASVQRARDLLNQGPTASGAGAMVDGAMNFFGKNSKGAETAAALDVVAGGLLRSIPRMEGPQSDKDVENYKIQAGRAADRNVPVPQRLAALDEVEKLNLKYAKLNGGAPSPEGGWEPSKPQGKAPIPMKGMTMDGYKFKGGNPADQSNWEKL